MTSRRLLDGLDSKSKKRISTLGSPDIISKVTEWVPTGCLPLDIIMGGGIPVGRMIEIYGDTSTGKSLLAGHILAETQAMGGIAVLFDSESATDEGVMVAVGVDPDDLIYSTPETVEEVYEDFIHLLEAKAKEDARRKKEEGGPEDLMVIIWDSVAATSTKGELEAIRKKGMGAATMAIHARLISQMCRVVNTSISRRRLAVVFINQTRQKIGVMFGPDKSTFGGRAIAYYSSVRLEMKHIGKIGDKRDGIIGINVRVGVAKNKVAKPFGQCEFPIIFDQGIDESTAILDWMIDRELVTGGGWKVLELGGEDIKFQRSGWEDLYYQNEQAIRGLVTDEADVQW